MLEKTNKTMCEHSNGWRPEDGVPDLAMMSDITAEGINVNLRTRYQRDQIYTFSGSVLIAVNPYKQLDIYNSDWISRYRQQKLDQNDPHIFALTEAMYMNLVMQEPAAAVAGSNSTSASPLLKSKDSFGPKDAALATAPLHRKNQACVISGESGAGKTETTKFILSYLCSVTPNKSIWMEHQILEANTILEAFGNAKTVRNDNSSRFGKFIQICFDSRHQINGCIIQDYLLEQSRITYQSIKERNYHVFYQLLAAGQANQDLRKKFHLMPANFYDYLNKTQCYTVDGVDDCAMFDSLRMAMSVLNMEQESCDGLFSILSAILWLGNMQFQYDDKSQSEQCTMTENDVGIMEVVSELLGIDLEKLEPIMLKRQINVRGNVTEIPFKLHEARDNRNAMAKALYSRLFSWVVQFINASTNPDQDNACFLGVLDIFGFENFETNSFEQLCINYANEKLHKFFNHHMFAMEQELYQREGIQFCDINYTDNTPCLELLERPPNCILRLLSEECRVPKGNDTTFIEKLHTEFSLANPNPFYIKGNDRRNWTSEFSIRHFAGSVTYTVGGFLKKNKDAQQSQLFNVIETSTNLLLKDFFGPRDSNDSSVESIPKPSYFRRESVDSRLDERNSIRSKLISQQSICSNPSSNGPSPGKLRRESTFNFDGVHSKISNGSFSNNTAKSRPTVADAFRHQLTSLVDLLNSVNPWYVRCIKPNMEKSAIGYDSKQVLMQLKYLGMTDLIRIRREGYPIHLTKHQFVCRYRCLMLKHLRINTNSPPIGLDEERLEKYCSQMMNHFQLNPKDWKIGKTMVLLRASVYQPMEERRNALMIEMATLIQSFWRAYTKQAQFKRMRISAIRIQETFRAYRGRLLYSRKKRAVLTIQAFVRGMFAREVANALREIKRVEQEKARQMELEKLARERERIEEEEKKKRLEFEKQEAAKMLENSQNNPPTQITITEASGESKIEAAFTASQNPIEANDKARLSLECTSTGASSPTSQSQVSPAVSSSTSWVGAEAISNQSTKGPSAKDKMEMDELVKVLDRHGVSLDTLEKQGANGIASDVYADFEKLYDVLGNQLQANCDGQSISPSINDDDRCSFATTGTCDADSVSCSGQSQMSSSNVTDDMTCNDQDNTNNRRGSTNSQEQSTMSTKDETINQNSNQDAVPRPLNENKFNSNSIESIASIVSSTSIPVPATTCDSNQLTGQDHDQQQATSEAIRAEQLIKQALEQNQAQTSTFTGNPILVTGSKLVTNGRPLTRIEEEPNSTATSPSKTPFKKRGPEQGSTKPQGLFPPEAKQEGGAPENTPAKSNPCSEFQKRRLERKILQVQQEQYQIRQPINPTTAGLPPPPTVPVAAAAPNQDQQSKTTIINSQIQNSDSIYDIETKNNIIEYAEQTFNNHPRESNASGVIRTLTRRRRSVDGAGNTEYLSKGEMLTYNSSHTIPTSHIKLHDPHCVQISCSMFKNLCKYMTGDGLKFDTETRIVQSIIRHGIDRPELRDEIYIQVIRQLTKNPNHEYVLRLWILLGLISAAFSPSKNFSKHLIAYIRNKPKKDPSITCHAQFCLDNLQAPRLGARKYPPSPLEIQACKSLTNLTCKIYLLDGRCETLSVHPCDTALDALTKLGHRIELQSIEGWALYESYSPGSSKYPHPAFEQKGDFERTVKSHTFMADVMAFWQDGKVKNSGTTSNYNSNNNNNISLKVAQKRLDKGNFKLTLKKKIFRGPKIRNDPVEIGLLYAQVVHNVVKRDSFFVDENLALSLAGIQAQVMLGNATEACKTDIVTKKGVSTKTSRSTNKQPSQMYEIDLYICQRLRNQTSRSKKEWCNLIWQSHRQFHNVNEVFCKMRYLSMVIYHCPLYGTATFTVSYKGYQTMDQNLMLGINAEGLVFIRAVDKALINAYRYGEICNETGIVVYADENIIQFNVKDRGEGSNKCLTFESTENEEIALLMCSYYPSLNVYVRGSSTGVNYALETSFDQNIAKKKTKLKMTLEDRMRTHQEVQNARRAIIKTGKLRKPVVEDQQAGLLKHTLKRLSSNKLKSNEKLSRFENIYGTSGKPDGGKGGDLPQTSSDYNIYGSMGNQIIVEDSKDPGEEVAGATATTATDEFTKLYPHRYWAYTKYPLRNSLLIIYDPDLEAAALTNFNAILTYSGLINPAMDQSNSSTIDSSSIDSGIASQQSLGNGIYGKSVMSSSPSSGSSSDIYDVCPKKMDERDLIRLAQGILDRCLKRDADILKNEFFIQLIKQTTDHPNPSSEINRRHWQLLALACSVTYPSDGKILSYLFAHLRRCSLDQITDEGHYAQFTLRSLQGTLDTKGRRYAPSESEILSTINCRRVYARVYFLDGQFQAVEFDPCATIAEVVDQIKQKIGLRSECGGYSLFQPLGDDCEQVLAPEEKVGDALAEWEMWHRQRQSRTDQQHTLTTAPALTGNQISLQNSMSKTSLPPTSNCGAAKNKAHKFVFKKYLFVDSMMDLNDPVERELLYFQTVASIKDDKFPVLEQEATILCALKAQIEIGDYTKLSNLPREHIRMVYKQVIMSLMPPHAFNNLPIPAIAQQHQAFRELSCADTKKYFFNLVQSFGRANFANNPGYILLHRAYIYDATQTFVTAWPSDIWVVINQSGLHMLIPKSRRVLASCEYRQIIDYSANNNYLIVIMLANTNSKLKYTFYTRQANQIAQQMKDYIIVASSSGNKRRKSVEFNLKQANASAAKKTEVGVSFQVNNSMPLQKASS